MSLQLDGLYPPSLLFINPGNIINHPRARRLEYMLWEGGGLLPGGVDTHTFTPPSHTSHFHWPLITRALMRKSASVSITAVTSSDGLDWSVSMARIVAEQEAAGCIRNEAELPRLLQGRGGVWY